MNDSNKKIRQLEVEIAQQKAEKQSELETEKRLSELLGENKALREVIGNFLKERETHWTSQSSKNIENETSCQANQPFGDLKLLEVVSAQRRLIENQERNEKTGDGKKKYQRRFRKQEKDQDEEKTLKLFGYLGTAESGDFESGENAKNSQLCEEDGENKERMETPETRECELSGIEGDSVISSCRTFQTVPQEKQNEKSNDIMGLFEETSRNQNQEVIEEKEMEKTLKETKNKTQFFVPDSVKYENSFMRVRHYKEKTKENSDFSFSLKPESKGVSQRNSQCAEKIKRILHESHAKALECSNRQSVQF